VVNIRKKNGSRKVSGRLKSVRGVENVSGKWLKRGFLGVFDD